MLLDLKVKKLENSQRFKRGEREINYCFKAGQDMIINVTLLRCKCNFPCSMQRRCTKIWEGEHVDVLMIKKKKKKRKSFLVLSVLGTHVYLWRIHFNIWQNQYNIVKLKKKKSQRVSLASFQRC